MVTHGSPYLTGLKGGTWDAQSCSEEKGRGDMMHSAIAFVITGMIRS